MIRRRGLSASVLLIAITALFIGALPALAQPAVQAVDGIDDPSGDRNAPGVNVIRSVESSDSVVVRLNRGDRQAHFSIMVRGIDVVDIDDPFNKGNGVDGGFDDDNWGGCWDELLPGVGTASGNRGEVAQAKFYTCNQHDSIMIHLGTPDEGASPAIKIVFTDGVLVNTDGVFVGDDPTDVGEGWIELFT